MASSLLAHKCTASRSFQGGLCYGHFLGWPWPGWILNWAALLQDLHKKYSYIRKTRPDGNCFYRAFGFSHLEALLDDSKELQR